jgi:hypothetical protein
MTIPFEKLKKESLKSPPFRAEYDRLKPEFALAAPGEDIGICKARANFAQSASGV